MKRLVSIGLMCFLTVFFLQGCLMSCNDCNCKDDNTLIGQYVCERFETTETEHLVMLKDSSYVHIFNYTDTIIINSDYWFMEKEEIADLTFKQWLDPFYYNTINDDEWLFDFSKYSDMQKAPKSYTHGCYDDYDLGCLFRIYFSEEDRIHFRRTTLLTDTLKLSKKPIFFYNPLDSINFYDAIERNNITLQIIPSIALSDTIKVSV